MLAQADPPTAILYWSDAMAIAGMDVAREHGVSVPLDLSIVGFDDLPIAGRVSPRLSSIRQETVDIGESMARRLIDRIEGKLQGAYGRIVSPTLFIERESTSARRA
jgi:LacI family transcriptional regulator